MDKLEKLKEWIGNNILPDSGEGRSDKNSIIRQIDLLQSEPEEFCEWKILDYDIDHNPIYQNHDGRVDFQNLQYNPYCKNCGRKIKEIK